MVKLSKIKVADVPTRWETRCFGTGALARILAIDEWRVKNFALGRAYGLAASATIGTAKRRIRIFSMFDTLKIATAWELTQFGFAPEAIGEAVKALDEPLLREWASAAEIEAEVSSKTLRLLIRTREAWALMPTAEPTRFLTSDGGFVLNLPLLVEKVIARIRELEEKGGC